MGEFFSVALSVQSTKTKSYFPSRTLHKGDNALCLRTLIILDLHSVHIPFAYFRCSLADFVYVFANKALSDFVLDALVDMILLRWMKNVQTYFPVTTNGTRGSVMYFCTCLCGTCRSVIDSVCNMCGCAIFNFLMSDSRTHTASPCFVLGPFLLLVHCPFVYLFAFVLNTFSSIRSVNSIFLQLFFLFL